MNQLRRRSRHPKVRALLGFSTYTTRVSTLNHNNDQLPLILLGTAGWKLNGGYRVFFSKTDKMYVHKVDTNRIRRNRTQCNGTRTRTRWFFEAFADAKDYA